MQHVRPDFFKSEIILPVPEIGLGNPAFRSNQLNFKLFRIYSFGSECIIYIIP
jgi:hypothetical protein